MKTHLIQAKSMLKILLAAILLVSYTNCGSTSVQNDPTPKKKKNIKMAILLDTSNSMDGLIDQAKSQLWSIVNELAKAKCDNEKPDLKIALYEYGNDNLPLSEGYIRMVTPLTDDLDQISEDLFALKTCGGQEFCGQVVRSALHELQWDKANGDYQVIFIAGNEPFTQGKVNYRSSCIEAKSKGVIVNTIYCGSFEEGVLTQWKDGAISTGGEYLSIDQDKKTVYIETPYDDQIVKLNEQLNKTYIFYGASGKVKKENQVRQDANASTFGKGNEVKRAVSKSSYMYKNSSWDLVDASKDKTFDIKTVKTEELPEEMQKLSLDQRTEYVKEKSNARALINKQIAELNIQREKYIQEQQKAESDKGMLDNAILESVKKQAIANQFVF